MAFSADELERYARHIVLREVGGPGQQKLKAARVLTVGAGGIGSPALLYPAPAGTVPTCEQAGILGALAGVAGSLAALEVIREIVGFGEGLVGKLLMLDARSMRFETLRYRWNPENPLSGEGRTIGDLAGLVG